ncbi:MAG: hydrogenase formation protein HypD [Bryobacteraceae bacterium]|nr:hydrogenase formation protein HypD [Bryobacteraceae bacterium]
MKLVDEYRDAAVVARLSAEIRRVTTRPWTLMEICGGQTHSIVKNGLEALLPEGIELVHGPGCPVCVTPVELIDAAIEIAAKPGVVFTSFGDMLRVPGSRGSLLEARAAGADVRIVYSALDAVKLAAADPSVQVVFFAVGFETTAPGNALAVLQAEALKLDNFSILVAHVLVPPAIAALLASPACRVQAFLAPGHVCAIEGAEEYAQLCARWKVPIVVTGFEPVDLLEGILMAVRQLEAGEARLENQYRRVVRESGNVPAREAVASVFEVTDRAWRGLGVIQKSGLALRPRFAKFDALARFGVGLKSAGETGECLSGLVLQGLKKPLECPAFGTRCTPEHPLGAPMVSSEGACAAYYHYGRKLV